MIGILIVLLLSPDLEAADRLAAVVREIEDQTAKEEAAAKALAAYDAILKAHPKDRKLVPRVRRKRAALYKTLGRPREALHEHDLIVEGRARRRDKARALCDGAVLLKRAADFAAAELRLRRAIVEYPDVTSVRAKASLTRGEVLEAMGRPRDAEKAYRFVVRRCWDEAKHAIRAYDALALLALRERKPDIARRWLRDCVKRYEKRAARGDRYGAFLSRQLGAMKAPKELARPPPG